MSLKTWAAKILAKQLGKKLKEGPVDTKKWWLSKTLWSNVVIVVIGTYEMVKANLVPSLPSIPPFVLTLLGALGVYGRATATQTLSK